MFVPFGGDRGDQKTPVPERVDRIHSCTLQVPLHLTKVLLYSPIHHHNTSSQMLEVTGKNRPRKQTDRQTHTHTHTEENLSLQRQPEGGKRKGDAVAGFLRNRKSQKPQERPLSSFIEPEAASKGQREPTRVQKVSHPEALEQRGPRWGEALCPHPTLPAGVLTTDHSFPAPQPRAGSRWPPTCRARAYAPSPSQDPQSLAPSLPRH
jgi:hypothetical protein